MAAMSTRNCCVAGLCRPLPFPHPRTHSHRCALLFWCDCAPRDRLQLPVSPNLSRSPLHTLAILISRDCVCFAPSPETAPLANSCVLVFLCL